MPPPPLLRARRRSPSYTLAPSPAPYTMLRRHALAAAAPAATSCAPPAPPVRLSGLRRRRPCCYPAAEHSRLLCPSCSPAAEHSRLRCEFIGGSDVRSDRNDCSVHSDSDYCPFGDEGEQAAANAGGPAACDFDGYSSEDYSETDLIIDNISDLGKGSHGQSEGPLQVVDLDGLNNQENINVCPFIHYVLCSSCYVFFQIKLMSSIELQLFIRQIAIALPLKLNCTPF
ncbi:uncharacterized protein LOC104581712 [Brachypodium distachyon]|uniref:Uncharacterized protein n=1 Tax=Brachypodium distachyon TaxID=15368 RepID=A0A0Q3JSX2_BRADI|nr:uncharacterized protein LOC104581712 [Brachypodium distachyon]KQK20747.1 hypothetical protein BRADI_1g56612v3 [Brachypodium distachyon]|eukprot:XP_010228325.1 uncharacterized protein LOC104581712 [Brachypodium distachyon]